ncbi:MAG: hypothetical protein QW041_03215 [Candidatus Pacearchaeota archaeon]
MDTKVLLNLIEEMISQVDIAEKDKKAVKKILELNKEFQNELEK